MNHHTTYDPDGFEQYLFDSSNVSALKERFMLIWTRKFFGMRQTWPEHDWSNQLPRYLEELNRSGRYQPWQIRQADQAVRLYFTEYLKRN